MFLRTFRYRKKLDGTAYRAEDYSDSSGRDYVSPAEKQSGRSHYLEIAAAHSSEHCEYRKRYRGSDSSDEMIVPRHIACEHGHYRSYHAESGYCEAAPVRYLHCVDVSTARNYQRSDQHKRHRQTYRQPESHNRQREGDRGDKLDYPVARRDLLTAVSALSAEEYVAEDRNEVKSVQLMTAAHTVASVVRTGDRFVPRSPDYHDI